MGYKKTLHNDIKFSTGINSANCYQCGKCSAGCPVVEEMEFSSTTVMRMIQIEKEQTDKKLLCSQAIWLCISCGMCLNRCPMEIDIPKIMDYLRQHSLQRKLQNKQANNNIIPFHYSFWNSIKYIGRLYEIGLIFNYKLKTFSWLQDLNLVPTMLLKGKLNIFPEYIKDKKSLLTIFKRIKKQ